MREIRMLRSTAFVKAGHLEGLDQLLHRLGAEGVIELRPIDDDPGNAIVAHLVKDVFECGGVSHWPGRSSFRGSGVQIMFMPPATEIVCPVMKFASSDARKATMPA